jgi:hypothetical protein
MAPQVTETGSFSLTTTTGNQTLVSEFFDLWNHLKTVINVANTFVR